ncbi:hypothetical protein WICMUC_003055 [Wickerhamomyces mucosus]|uniref:Phosphatidic acid phosphatase type 2/haloperoxidase domain-containing protein n=1 Tax=Wickerhamomyces mucosus TaxID=1378264 RepID=A0A9P8PML4_9ASCO|nr:hypothetical protein WICMUC_003055 [Wickerhamomyces mucosus]
MALNRISFGLERLTIFPVLKKWRISDVLLIPVLFILTSYIDVATKPFQRQFVINDVTINHPFTEHERVPSQLNIFISLILPIPVILFFTLIFGHPKNRLYLGYVSILGLFISWFSNELFTDILKNWIGRHRPDFIARCIPREDAPKDILVFAKDVCTTKNLSILEDGFRTTPSGHSSGAFSGLFYLTLWLQGQLLADQPFTGSWRKLLSLVPAVVAALIAISRTEDYRHHFVDVIIGSAIGVFFSYWSYRRNFPALNSPISFKPILDESDAGDEVEAVLTANANIETRLFPDRESGFTSHV